MTDRSYAIMGDGFTLQGVIDEARLHLMVRLLDKAARELALAPTEIGVQKYDLEITRDDILEMRSWSEGLE
jgi:hypothetical protein